MFGTSLDNLIKMTIANEDFEMKHTSLSNMPATNGLQKRSIDMINAEEKEK